MSSGLIQILVLINMIYSITLVQYVGNSGTSLAVPVPHNDLMNEAPLIDGFSIATHGFAVLFPNMEVVFHAVDGRVLEKIHLQ